MEAAIQPSSVDPPSHIPTNAAMLLQHILVYMPIPDSVNCGGKQRGLRGITLHILLLKSQTKEVHFDLHHAIGWIVLSLLDF